MTQLNPKYKRVIIKLSGEALAGANGTGIDPEKLTFAKRSRKSRLWALTWV